LLFGALGNGGFAPAVSAGNLETGGSVAALSTPASAALAVGTLHCNSVSADAAAGKRARSPSANRLGSGDDGLDAYTLRF